MLYTIGLLTAWCALITLVHFALWRLLKVRRVHLVELTNKVETRNQRVAVREQFGWFVATLIVALLLASLSYAVYQKFRENSPPARSVNGVNVSLPASHA